MEATEYEAQVNDGLAQKPDGIQQAFSGFDGFESGSCEPLLEEQVTGRHLIREYLPNKLSGHINRVFRTVFEVKRIAAEETDPIRLLMSACRSLVADGGYLTACITRIADTRGIFGIVQAGSSGGIRPRAKWFECVDLPECCRTVLLQPDVVVLREERLVCGDCPLMKQCQDKLSMSIRLACDGRVYGMLSVTTSAEDPPDSEEQALIKEVAEIISHGLRDLEL